MQKVSSYFFIMILVSVLIVSYHENNIWAENDSKSKIIVSEERPIPSDIRYLLPCGSSTDEERNKKETVLEQKPANMPLGEYEVMLEKKAIEKLISQTPEFKVFGKNDSLIDVHVGNATDDCPSSASMSTGTFESHDGNTAYEFEMWFVNAKLYGYKIHDLMFSPYQQLQNEVDIHDINCDIDLELHIKDNKKPLCLKSSTYEKLVQRGYF